MIQQVKELACSAKHQDLILNHKCPCLRNAEHAWHMPGTSELRDRWANPKGVPASWPR